MPDAWENRAEKGDAVEVLVTRWLRRRGYTILPTGKLGVLSGDDDKTPVVLTPTDGSFVRLGVDAPDFPAPDAVGFLDGTFCLIEIKGKGLSRWLDEPEWCFSVSARGHFGYHVAAASAAGKMQGSVPVYLFVLARPHDPNKPYMGDPPTGLFVALLSYLRPHHTSPRDSETAEEVWFDIANFKRVAEYADVLRGR